MHILFAEKIGKRERAKEVEMLFGYIPFCFFHIKRKIVFLLFSLYSPLNAGGSGSLVTWKGRHAAGRLSRLDPFARLYCQGRDSHLKSYLHSWFNNI